MIKNKTDTDNLKYQYHELLCNLRNTQIAIKQDSYSGVFLSQAHPDYWCCSKKIMIVGRETAGWLGEKWPGGKISLSTIINANDEEMMNIIEQSLIRYQKFLKATKPGKSKFKQFYYKVAEILKVKPTSLIYANFFAWDFKGRNIKTYRQGRNKEISTLINYSTQLLKIQIIKYKPDFIIFATGCDGIDDLIKTQLTEGNYSNLEEYYVARQLWAFVASFEDFNVTCFRIPHPMLRTTRIKK